MGGTIEDRPVPDWSVPALAPEKGVLLELQAAIAMTMIISAACLRNIAMTSPATGLLLRAVLFKYHTPQSRHLSFEGLKDEGT